MKKLADNIDSRTKAYFKKIKENMQYLGGNACWYGIQEILDKKAPGIIAEAIGQYPGYVNSSKIIIYQYEIGGQVRYCAELSYQTDIDDFCIETHIFAKYPSEKNIILLRKIEDIENKMNFFGLKFKFSCWECGCETHWLDIPGTIEDKINGLEDSYCGC